MCFSVLLCNPDIYKDPQRFWPERFIENGKVKTSHELIPFSIGENLGNNLE